MHLFWSRNLLAALRARDLPNWLALNQRIRRPALRARQKPHALQLVERTPRQKQQKGTKVPVLLLLCCMFFSYPIDERSDATCQPPSLLRFLTKM